MVRRACSPIHIRGCFFVRLVLSLKLQFKYFKLCNYSLQYGLVFKQMEIEEKKNIFALLGVVVTEALLIRVP